MNTRINIASPIFKDLIFRDLDAAIKNPMINAQRALLFADALLVADAISNENPEDESSMEIQIQSKETESEHEILVRAAKARFATLLDSRRGTGRKPVN